MTGRELHDRSGVTGVCGDGVCGLSAVALDPGPGRDRAGRRWPDWGWAGDHSPWVGVLVGAVRWCTHQLPSQLGPTPVIEPNNDRLVAGGAGVCVRRGGRCTSQASTAVLAMVAGWGGSARFRGFLLPSPGCHASVLCITPRWGCEPRAPSARSGPMTPRDRRIARPAAARHLEVGTYDARRPEVSAQAHGARCVLPRACQMRRTRGVISPDLEVSLVPISGCH